MPTDRQDSPMRRRTVILSLLFGLLAGAAVAQPAMLVLDGSASMWGRTEERSRIDIAREALRGLMHGWAEGRPVGLVAYGHRHAQDCADVELLRGPMPGPAGIVALAETIVPRGRTPLAEAVRQAAEALGTGGGSVILVTDGIDTCHPDPCAVAQAIARSGARIAIHTIGFAVSDPAAIAQLRCMAEATGGRAQLADGASDLAAALDRAAAAPLPGARASAPRGEPVPVPRLVVTLRLCSGCDPMTGDARIVVRRGEEMVATIGDPFGRFFDLPQGDYLVSVETLLFERGPIAASVPRTGAGRAELLLDAGWLVGDVRSAPSGLPVTAQARLEWLPGAAANGDQPLGAEAIGHSPAFLVPAGTHRLRALVGNAEGGGEASVAAGEVVVLAIPVRFGTLALRRLGFGAGNPRVSVTAIADDRVVFDDWPDRERVEIPLAPGRYRVAAIRAGAHAEAEVEIRSETVEEVTLRPAE
jgi:Ca-activated chloride channel family protein